MLNNVAVAEQKGWLNSGSPHGSDEEGSEIIIPVMLNNVAVAEQKCCKWRGMEIHQNLTSYAVTGCCEEKFLRSHACVECNNGFANGRMLDGHRDEGVEDCGTCSWGEKKSIFYWRIVGPVHGE